MVRDANCFHHFEDGICSWTVSDASSLTCQSLNQVHLVYSSMSSGLLTRSKLNTVIRCGTTEKVAMELLPKIFGFMIIKPIMLLKLLNFKFWQLQGYKLTIQPY